MNENIEAELRLLVRQVSERATRGGGLDRLTYEALTAASVVLSSQAPAGEGRGREEALCAAQARLRACEVGRCVKAA
jgi:hypothetical protein